MRHYDNHPSGFLFWARTFCQEPRRSRWNSSFCIIIERETNDKERKHEPGECDRDSILRRSLYSCDPLLGGEVVKVHFFPRGIV
jgi:hypothetical protein